MATGGEDVGTPVSGRLRSQGGPQDDDSKVFVTDPEAIMRKARSTREKLLQSQSHDEGESVAYYQKFLDMGAELELSGASLRSFADAKMKEIECARADRDRLYLEKKKLAAAERQEKIEREKLEEAKKQRELEEKKLGEARVEAQKQRDEAQKQREEARVEAQRQREFEEDSAQRKEKLERDKLEEMRRLQDEAQENAERLETQRADNRRSLQKEREGMVESSKVTLPEYDESKEDIEAYLTKFERFAEDLKWDKATWARRVSTKLNVKATTLIGDMSKEDARDYQLVKKELLRGFQCTAESYREKFRAAKRKNEETFSTFVSRITRYLYSWMDLAGKKKQYDDLFDLVLLEQLLTGIPQSVVTFIRQSKATTVAESVEHAQCFVDARPGFDSSLRNGKKHDQKKADSPNTGGTAVQYSQGRGEKVEVKCRVCGGGHFARNCPKAEATKAGRERDLSHVRCYRCRKFGHLKKNCPEVPLIRCTNPEEPDGEGVFLAEGKKARYEIHSGLCGKCDRRTQGETFDMTARVNGQVVVAIRDTGSPMLCVSADLIDPATYTARTREVSGVFGEHGAVQAPIAIVKLESSVFVGDVEAVAIRNMAIPVLIGNFMILPNGREVRVPVYGKKNLIPPVCAAVQTRGQARKEERGDIPLKTQGVPMIQKTCAEMAQAQESDPHLKRVRELGVEKKPWHQQGTGWVRFVIRKALLYREYSGADKVDHRQLVVPSEFRGEVMRLAHDAPMAGHLGGRRTRSRIWNEFYWPGMCPDIRRYVASCDACQRTTAKGRVKPVPLERMPLIDVPFKQVAVDIIGPIHPPSDRGHRFILVTVDYATRYPEATPLKKIDTPHVAEALWENWTRVGIPEKVLSDNGSQFKSGMMKEVYNLMSVHGMYTTPYHAQCNGLVERFNGTLKQMLKRLCQEQPTEWDRFIPACLFAYREVPQESLKFSPFELLYGRTVRGPMQVLRKLWTKEEADPELRTTAEYVVDLRNRLEETCRIARENLGRAAERYAGAADRKAVDRQFKEGDEVLLLLPMKKNKLEIAWRGPYVIKERCGINDYRIKVGNKKKLFHANLLKKYIKRTEIPAVVAVVLEEEEMEEVQEVAAGLSNIPLVPLVAEEGPGDVSIEAELSASKQQELRDLTTEFEQQFTDLPGTTNLEECEITLLEDTPVRVRQYPLPHSAMDCIRREVQDMLKLGVIEPCASPYSAPLILIRKPDGKMRTCQDFRKLNRIVRFDGEPLPDVEYLFAKLHKAKYLSKLDLTKGYWQIPVKETDRDKTAFTTPQGQFRWVKMPFGLKTAGAIFSRLMRKLIEPMGRNDVDNFVDDVLISNEEWTEHLRALRAVLTRMAVANLAARPKKCFLGYRQVVYLGHKVGRGCMMPEEAKIVKFKTLKEPQTKKEVRRFLGMLGFYRRYVPHFSEIALPLTNLTKGKKCGVIKWTPSCQEAFERLKKTLVSRPVIRLPDPEKAFVLRTDASEVGLGAVLLQEDEKGDLQPVSYASKKLIPAETNYSTIEKECLAIVWGIGKFEPYLYGQHFTVMTDHQPLQYLQQVRPHNGRLTRWALQLQAYSFRVQTIKGVDNVDADFMSRVAIDI